MAGRAYLSLNWAAAACDTETVGVTVDVRDRVLYWPFAHAARMPRFIFTRAQLQEHLTAWLTYGHAYGPARGCQELYDPRTPPTRRTSLDLHPGRDYLIFLLAPGAKKKRL